MKVTEQSIHLGFHKLSQIARGRVCRVICQTTLLAGICIALAGCKGAFAGTLSITKPEFQALATADQARDAAKAVRAHCPEASAQADAADQAAKDADAAAEALHSAGNAANDAQKNYLDKQVAQKLADDAHEKARGVAGKAEYDLQQFDANAAAKSAEYQKAREKLDNAEMARNAANDAVRLAEGLADQAQARGALAIAKSNLAEKQGNINALNPARPPLQKALNEAERAVAAADQQRIDALHEEQAAKQQLDDARAALAKAETDANAKIAAARAATAAALNACPAARSSLAQLPPDSHSPGQDVHNSDNPTGHPGGTPIPTDPSNRVTVEPGDPY